MCIYICKLNICFMDGKAILGSRNHPIMVRYGKTVQKAVHKSYI